MKLGSKTLTPNNPTSEGIGFKGAKPVRTHQADVCFRELGWGKVRVNVMEKQFSQRTGSPKHHTGDVQRDIATLTDSTACNSSAATPRQNTDAERMTLSCSLSARSASSADRNPVVAPACCTYQELRSSQTRLVESKDGCRPLHDECSQACQAGVRTGERPNVPRSVRAD